jgi:hypothetical protein
MDGGGEGVAVNNNRHSFLASAETSSLGTARRNYDSARRTAPKEGNGKLKQRHDPEIRFNAVALTKPKPACTILVPRNAAECARVAELADALDSGSSGRKAVEVRVLSRAPKSFCKFSKVFSFLKLF